VGRINTVHAPADTSIDLCLSLFPRALFHTSSGQRSTCAILSPQWWDLPAQVHCWPWWQLVSLVCALLLAH